MGPMAMVNKVEICGVNTSELPVLSAATMRKLLERVKQGDQAARAELVQGNLRLVLSVIQRFNNRGEYVDDLFQVGCIGLMKAIDNFDLEQNVKFSTYAVPMIIGEIRRYLRDNNPIRVSRSLRDTAYKALQVRDALTNRLPREPTVGQIAEELKLPREDVVFALDAIQDPISLFEPIYHDGGDPIHVMDQIADDRDADGALARGNIDSGGVGQAGAPGAHHSDDAVFPRAHPNGSRGRNRHFPSASVAPGEGSVKAPAPVHGGVAGDGGDVTVRNDSTARGGQARRARGRGAMARAAVAAAASFALLAAGWLFSSSTAAAEHGGAMPADTMRLPANAIRLHVVGHSDEAADQRVKLAVRDALLPELEGLAQRHGGWAAVPWERSLDRLEAVARGGVLERHGFAYGARALWRREPAVGYELHAGYELHPDFSVREHMVLRIVLGDGAGANWWCVLFPPLCFVDVLPGMEMVADTRADGEAQPGEGAEGDVERADGSDGRSPLRLGLRALAALAHWREGEGWANWSTSLFGQAAQEGLTAEEAPSP